MSIRPATSADIDTLRAFEQVLIDVERAFDTDLRPEGVRYYDLDALIAGPDSTVLVVERAGGLQACGYVQLRDAKPVYHHTRIGYIGFLYVEPSARGQGLVQSVIDALCEWTRARGVGHVELGVYTQNSAAIAAYDRAGFSAISQTMIKAL